MTAKKVLTKAERIANITQQIERLLQKKDDLINDRVTVKAKKVLPLPNKGDEVYFSYGRKTPTSKPRELVGVVLGVKPKVDPDVNGKGGTPALIRVMVGDDVDAEILTIYPTQIKPAPVVGEDTVAE